ncbi:MAG: dioxygenase, partial [Betaproteobacteria bacterium]|nr:dioxygenase [Betaproteobacteria bacterium]
MSAAPAVFVSHGSPMLPLEPGSAAPMLRQLGRELLARRPRAVLVMSPHWMTRGVAVGANERPATLYDFHGFDPALRTLRYPVDGDPALAARALELLQAGGVPAALDPRRGLDHGVWVPLRLMFEQGELPVVPLSMPWPLDAAQAWGLGELLRPLREQGVLLLGSGSLTHNLHEFRGGATVDDPPEPYVLEFVAWVREAIARGDGEALRDWAGQAPHALRAHPTP